MTLRPWVYWALMLATLAAGCGAVWLTREPPAPPIVGEVQAAPKADKLLIAPPFDHRFMPATARLDAEVFDPAPAAEPVNQFSPNEPEAAPVTPPPPRPRARAYHKQHKHRQ